MRRALCLVVWGLLTLLTIPTPATCAEPAKLAILPFQVNSSEDLGYLQKGLSDMLASRVVQEGGIKVLDRSAIQALQSEYASGLDPVKAAALGKKLGADFLVFGSINKLGSHVSLDGEVVDVGKGTSGGRLSAEAPNLDGVIPQIGRLAQEIRRVALGQQVSSRSQSAAAAPAPLAAGLPQQQIVPAAPGAAYPIPPGGYPVPPGGFTGRVDDLFTKTEDLGGVQTPDQQSLNPAFIMAYQADKVRRGFVKSPELRLSDIQAVDVGDTDGDGSPDTVIADEDRIYIYKNVLEDTTQRVIVNPVAARAKVLSLDVADLNRNGVAEIYITALVENGEKLVSQVVEYRNGKYEVIAKELPYFLRVTRSIQEGPVLFAQEKRSRLLADRTSDSMFNPFGNPFRMKWEGGKLVKGQELPLKDSVCVLGLTTLDVDRDGVDEYLAFDRRDYLKLFNANGGVVWVSSEPYGRTANFFMKDFARTLSPTIEAPDAKVWLPAKIVTVDLDGDGFEEVILCYNYEPFKLLSQTRFFTKSVIFSLSWDGTDFAENWRTREMKGYVSDYHVKDVDKDGKPELLVGLLYKRGTMDYLTSTASLIAFQLNVEKAKGPREKAKKEEGAEKAKTADAGRRQM